MPLNRVWFLPLSGSRTAYKNHISDSLSLEKGSYILLHFDSGIGGGVGGRGICSPLKQKIGKGRASHVLGRKTRMYLTIPVTSATSERTFSVLRRLKDYPRGTLKQSRQNRLNPQLPTDALSQIDYRHTKHFKDCSCQRTTQRAFW